MKIISNSTGRPCLQRVTRRIALGVFLIMAVTAPAHANDRDDHGRGDRDWRAHEGRVHGYEPGVVYAPPVVYTPPQYAEPGINLVIPLNFR